MNLLKPRFTIAGLLILIMLCAFAVENRVSSYRQQVVSARKIEKLGGEVLYGWHNPTVKDSVWFASSARPEIRNDGKRVMIPYTNPVPCRSICTSAPEEDPSWSIFDLTTNWDIQYVALPDKCFSSDVVELLGTLPNLRYIEVKWSGQGYYHSTGTENEQLRGLRESFPALEVIYMYDHLLLNEP